MQTPQCRYIMPGFRACFVGDVMMMDWTGLDWLHVTSNGLT